MTTPAAPLSPLGAAIAKSRTCHIQLTAAQIRVGIAEVRLLDQQSEKKSASGCTHAFIGAVGIIGGCFASAIAENPALLLVSLASLIWVIISVARRLIAGKTNFENRRYELLAQVTELLSKDMSPDAQFDLALNLMPQDDQSKFSHKGKSGRWDVKHYHDPWLTLEGRLLDGTKFSLHMAEKHQARSCRKRGRSGKMKFKSKSKNSSEATLFLKIKGDRYQQLATLGESAQGAVQLPPWAQTKVLDVTDESLTLRVTTPTSWKVMPAASEAKPEDAKQPKEPAYQGNYADGVELVMAMFLSLYQVLNLSRAIQKRQS